MCALWKMVRRVVLCGTHPDQTNGYAKVVYGLARALSAYDDIDLRVFGFQSRPPSEARLRSLPSNVPVFDAREEELARDVRKTTFGEDLIAEYVRKEQPDVVVIYNDFLVVSRMAQALAPVRETMPTMRVIAYLDMVYKCQNSSMVESLNGQLDGALVFLDHWADDLRRLGFTKPVEVLYHAVSRDHVFRVPRKLARVRFGIPQGAFVLLNPNRNQPRKRWDVCLMAFVKFCIARPKSDAILLVATHLVGAWNIPRTVREICLFLRTDPEPVLARVTTVDRPQQLTDVDMCLLYNAADVGINTCDGEGFGLCNFEHASVGVPQIVPDIDTFRGYLGDDCSALVGRGVHVHLDASSGVEGMGFIADADAVAEAIVRYYDDAELRARHGRRCLERTRLPHFTWDGVGARLREFLLGAFGG